MTADARAPIAHARRLRGRRLPVDPVLILYHRRRRREPGVMAVILLPPMFGRASPLARDVVPGVDAERRAAEAAVVGGIEGSVDRRRRPDPDLRPRRPDRGLGLPADDDRHRRRDRAVARDPARDLRPARVRRPVRRRRPRPAPGGHARSGQVRRRGVGGDHRRDAAGRADRRRRQPVLLRLPAHRRRRRARRLADRSRSRWPPRPHRLHAGGPRRLRIRARSVRRPWPRSSGQPDGARPARRTWRWSSPGRSGGRATRPSACRRSTR